MPLKKRGKNAEKEEEKWTVGRGEKEIGKTQETSQNRCSYFHREANVPRNANLVASGNNRSKEETQEGGGERLRKEPRQRLKGEKKRRVGNEDLRWGSSANGPS